MVEQTNEIVRRLAHLGGRSLLPDAGPCCPTPLVCPV